MVALDASPHSLAALQAAVDLAAARRLEVLALFVEDLRLLQATALPFAGEVGAFSGMVRPLDVAQTERRLHDLARRVEALVAASAERAEVPWSFLVRRGDVTAEILACAGEGDVLSLGAAGWSPMRTRALGETAGRLLRLARGPMLLARHGTRLTPPLLVLLEGARWRDTLETAIQLAGDAAGALVLAVPPGPAQPAREAEARAVLDAQRVGPTRIRLLAGAGPAALRALVRRERAGALLAPMDAGALQGEAGERLMATFDVPVILVRWNDAVTLDATPSPDPARRNHEGGNHASGNQASGNHEKSPLG